MIESNPKKEKKLVFILGQGRSGTTLLNRVLTSHPNIHFINYEFNDLCFFYENQPLYDKYGDRKYEVMSVDILNHPWMHDSFDCKGIRANDFADFIDKFFDFFRKKYECDVIGIKIASNIDENIRMIRNVVTAAVIIHIIRDPRDVFLSLKKTRFGTMSPYYAGKAWAATVDVIQRFGEEGSKYYELKYEDLICRPETKLRNLCYFMGIRFSEHMLTFYEKTETNIVFHINLNKDFIKDNFNKWKKELNGNDVKLIYMGTGVKIKTCGYHDQYEDVKINFFLRLKEYCFDKAFCWVMFVAQSIRNRMVFFSPMIFVRIYFFVIKIKRLIKL